MKKWLNYDKGTIFRDTSKNGLLVNFLKDYKNKFGGSINPSCMKCLNSYYFKFYNYYVMNENKKTHGFVLKKKYNGIISNITRQPYRNGDLTEEQAIELIEKHPAGESLFEKIPKSYFNKPVEKPVEKPKKKRVKKTK